MRGSVADTRCGWTACALPAVQPTTTQHLAMHRFPTSCRPPDALLTGTPEDVIDSPDPIKGDNHTCPIGAKVPTAADLGKQFGVRGDVLLDGLRGLTGDLFDVMSGAVVAILAMQTHHGRDVLLNEVGHISRLSGEWLPC